jgi:hypothetical protein
MSNVDIRGIKIQGGEEIVAEVVGEVFNGGNVTALKVRRPHILQFQQVAPGKVGLAFVPWTLSNPDIDRLDIPTSIILITYPVSATVQSNYIRQTTGLEIAPAGMKV